MKPSTRVGNSFSAAEVDLLTQITKGLVHRGKDLSYLSRHEAFAALANKVQVMLARSSGEKGKSILHAKSRVRRSAKDAVAAVVSSNPGLTTYEISLRFGKSVPRTSAYLTELVRAGELERRGNGKRCTYYVVQEPSNVVHLSDRKAASV